MLSIFVEFFYDGNPDLSRRGSYPDNSPELRNELNFNSDGDRAWYMFMIMASVKLSARDPDRSLETLTMSRKERVAVELKFVIDNSCLPLSKRGGFVRFVNKVSSLARRSFDDQDQSLKNDFEDLVNVAAMYKICMRLRKFDWDEFVEEVELHSRKKPERVAAARSAH